MRSPLELDRHPPSRAWIYLWLCAFVLSREVMPMRKLA